MRGSYAMKSTTSEVRWRDRIDDSRRRGDPIDIEEPREQPDQIALVPTAVVRVLAEMDPRQDDLARARPHPTRRLRDERRPRPATAGGPGSSG